MNWNIDEIKDILNDLRTQELKSDKNLDEIIDDIERLLDDIDNEIDDLEDDLSSCTQANEKDIKSLRGFKLAIGLNPDIDYSQSDFDEFKCKLGVYFIPTIPIPKKK